VMGGVEVQIPTEFAAFNWETYEPETFLQATNWIRENPNGLVLDLGCATGAFSAAALFASETSTVVAFDSDLASLVATRRFCKNAKGNRLRTVYGFVTDMNSVENANLAEAARQTESLLRKTLLSGDPDTTRYVNIATTENKDIPCWALDALLSGTQDRAILIKCDVEGAEMLVLRGAGKYIASHYPTLLLSVHP
jgi:FkbM family methyltransferase